jgi:hypothetical protein
MEAARSSKTLPTAQIHTAPSPKNSRDITITVKSSPFINMNPLLSLSLSLLSALQPPHLKLKVRTLGFQAQFSG